MGRYWSLRLCKNATMALSLAACKMELSMVGLLFCWLAPAGATCWVLVLVLMISLTIVPHCFKISSLVDLPVGLLYSIDLP